MTRHPGWFEHRVVGVRGDLYLSLVQPNATVTKNLQGCILCYTIVEMKPSDVDV